MSNIFGNITDYLTNGNSGASQNSAGGAAGVIANTQSPDLTALIPQLQLQVQQGKMTPAEYQAALQNPSAYLNIQTNPNNMSAAEGALSQEQGIATQGGMTAIDKAQLNDIQQQVANQNAAQSKAIQDQAQQQGLANGGTALAARQIAAQGTANSAANAGATVASNAQARALQALQGVGTLGTQLNAQDFAQQAQKAAAQDQINNFNATAKNQALQTNTANQQAANANNFSTANNIAGTNTGITNQNLMMPLQTAQQQFTNNLGQNTATSSAMLGAAKQQADNAKSQASSTSGLLSTAADLAPAALSFFSDEKMKEGVKDGSDDVEQMMEHLTGKKFKYKKGTAADDGGQQHVGVMAQEVKQAGLPTMQTPAGMKVQDNDTMKGAMLAALGNLHQRVKKMEGK